MQRAATRTGRAALRPTIVTLGGNMDTCLLYSPAITFVVALLKRIPFVGRNPKLVALVCAAALGAGHAYFATGAMPAVADLTRCVLEALAGAVATHEVVVKPVTGALGDTV